MSIFPFIFIIIFITLIRPVFELEVNAEGNFLVFVKDNIS